MVKNWHTKTKEEALAELNTSANGLSRAEAGSRLEEYGPNKLEEAKRKSPFKMLLQQFTEVMVVILIIAALLSLLLGKTTEAVAILAIVLLFGFLGFIQEYRAEKAMSALNRMVVPKVRVRRDGKAEEVPASELVPGDVVELEAGNVVPADLRLLEAHNLKVQEAALTGESEPIDKDTAPIGEEDIPLGDRKNMAYMGTVVTYGRGVAIAVSTGMKTELGKIANMIGSVETSKTPLQERLDKLGKMLAMFGAAAAALIFGVGLLMGKAAADMFLTAVSVAVAVVPEGLPAVVTITLALGGQRMLKRNALIRKLPAVETLGSVTVICSDKTGTLTQNKMTVTVVELPEHTVELDARDTAATAPEVSAALDFALSLSVLCNDATLEKDATPEQVIGDPTEAALLVAGTKRGIGKDQLNQLLPRVHEVPFDSTRKRMSTIHQVDGQLPAYLQPLQDSLFLLCTKGAPDSLLEVCSAVWVKGEEVPLNAAWKEKIHAANARLAENGIRVLGLAFRRLATDKTDADIEQELTFAGLAGMIDPPRQEVKAAVEECKQAGIRPIMITGDHPLTAAAIGRELHFTDHSEAVSGEQLQRTDEEELLRYTAKSSVYARVSPEDKLRIVSALQQTGEVVAMTGDGVNDSPALRKANIGVAMGITGTDVAKEAADMVLLDDNFATIVAAVKEGRVIFDNLVRFIKFSLAGNIGKVLIMLIAPFFGMVIALQPLQLLWLNLLTDGLLGLGLGTEPAEEDTMRRPPRDPEKGALEKKDFYQMAVVGVTIAAISLSLGIYYFNPANPEDLTWQTMIFATVGFGQVFQALALRSTAHSVFSIKTNPLLAALVVVAVLLQLAVLYLPFMESFFRLVPIALEDLLIALAAGSLVFVVVKLDKLLFKR
ncbi:Ca2+-transporting ATPase [Pontibacter ummariensis]|uniref:Ca2+-transporting ATPase n=1 Tax=Pontibacter ummariensis TaxID=1610492 RepID=A0A239KHY9_9BACT|nr:cation-translocating P-type ATPase [Pontibacter ummariensis]PRY06438.1 Ca2+-transporting ATPase [Pontibacter ummariensis]SNT17233.1 Ca2+-transporting ATPase [Pontibacter ummariensis]